MFSSIVWVLLGYTCNILLIPTKINFGIIVFVSIIASESATNKIPHKLEIEYGPTPGQKLDILGTDLPNGKQKMFMVEIETRLGWRCDFMFLFASIKTEIG